MDPLDGVVGSSPQPVRGQLTHELLGGQDEPVVADGQRPTVRPPSSMRYVISHVTASAPAGRADAVPV